MPISQNPKLVFFLHSPARANFSVFFLFFKKTSISFLWIVFFCVSCYFKFRKRCFSSSYTLYIFIKLKMKKHLCVRFFLISLICICTHRCTHTHTLLLFSWIYFYLYISDTTIFCYGLDLGNLQFAKKKQTKVRIQRFPPINSHIHNANLICKRFTHSAFLGVNLWFPTFVCYLCKLSSISVLYDMCTQH